MSLTDFIMDLFNPHLAFLPKALIVSLLSAATCAAVGVHVVLRGLSFVGDALSHAIFPGVALAFVMQGSILWGGLSAGLVVASLIACFSQNRRLKEDSLIGVFFVAAFSLGLVIVALAPGYTGSVESLLFGSLTGVTNSSILATVGFSAVIVGVLAGAHSRLVAVSVDREYARSLGLKLVWWDLLLYICIAATVVISVQTIGNILVLALLVTPGATARLVSDRVLPMMLWAAGFGTAASFLGVWLSWAANLPTGPAIVLVSTAMFLLVWGFHAEWSWLRCQTKTFN